MAKRILVTAPIALCLLVATAAHAQERAATDDRFVWSGEVADGRWIRIRNLSGEIIVEPASGNKVEVVATKRWRRGDPSVVRFETRKFGANDGDVLICALWGERAWCDEDGYETRNDRSLRNNDVSVEFRVLVPKGVRVGVSTVNGEVSVVGATSEVRAATVNGGVDVTTSGGPVRATTVNGRVHARMGRFTPESDLVFSTVNGNVVAEFTGDINGDLDLTTVNGSLRSDYAIMLTGRVDPRRLRAHIGEAGGPRIRLSTVNGNVELRRR